MAERKAAGTGSAKKITRRRTATAGDESAAAAPGAAAAPHLVCSVAFCPICLVVTAVGDASPELVDHLLVAGRELLLAVRAVIDARLQTMEEEPRSGLQRIEID